MRQRCGQAVTTIGVVLRPGAAHMAWLLLAFVLSWPLAVMATGQENISPLEVVPESAHLGEVPGKHNLVLEFQVKNRTDREIRLKYIFAECDCTLLVPDSAVVPAQGQYTLQAELLTEERNSGFVEEMITILTDEPGQTELEIPVSAYVMDNKDFGEERTR